MPPCGHRCSRPWRPVYRSISDVPGPIDIVDVFRRAEDIPPHLDDVLRARPKAVWFQSGIRNDAAAALGALNVPSNQASTLILQQPPQQPAK